MLDKILHNLFWFSLYFVGSMILAFLLFFVISCIVVFKNEEIRDRLMNTKENNDDEK